MYLDFSYKTLQFCGRKTSRDLTPANFRSNVQSFPNQQRTESIFSRRNNKSAHRASTLRDLRKLSWQEVLSVFLIQGTLGRSTIIILKVICSNREVPLSDDFVSAHILTEEEGGYFSSRSVPSLFLLFSRLYFSHSDGVVSVESCQGTSGWPDTLKLLEGPGYHPSYARWLQHCPPHEYILSDVLGVST